MKSFVTVVCPVSGKSLKVPYADTAEGVFAPLDGDEDLDLPPGWGRLALDVVRPNPEIEATKRARARALKEAMAGLKKASEDPEVPPEHRVQVKTQLASGEAKEEARRIIEGQYPSPQSDTVVLRLSYPVLSDEAVEALLKALKDAGFPIEV